MKTTNTNEPTPEQLRQRVRQLELLLSTNVRFDFVQFLRAIHVRPAVLDDFLKHGIESNETLYQIYKITGLGENICNAQVFHAHLIAAMVEDRVKSN